MYSAAKVAVGVMQMIRGKRHSRNAVAARARRRLAAAGALDERPGAAIVRRVGPDFVISIRSRSGERAQISATRFGRLFITGEGLRSARSIARGIELMLRLCEP